MRTLSISKHLLLQFIWRDGVFEKLPPTPRPIEVGLGSAGSWTPAELRGQNVRKDLIILPHYEEMPQLLKTFLHELGHALYTPTPSQNPKFWGEYQELGEILNIIEDLRIEGRMSQVLGSPFRDPQPASVLADNLLSAMIYLHLGYKVKGRNDAGGEKLVKRAERLLRRLYKASAWSALRLARLFKGMSPPEIAWGHPYDVKRQPPNPSSYIPIEAGGKESGGREGMIKWLEEVPPPALPPALIRLARELFKAPEPELVPSSSGRLVVSSYLRGDEEPFLRQEELPTIHPLVVVDCSGSMRDMAEETRLLLYALYKAGLKGSVLLVKDGRVKKVPIKDAYRASFSGSTEGLGGAMKEINASPLTLIITDLLLSDNDKEKVKKSLSHRSKVYWVYWGRYKEDFIKQARSLRIPKERVIAEDTLMECLKRLSKLLRG